MWDQTGWTALVAKLIQQSGEYSDFHLNQIHFLIPKCRDVKFYVSTRCTTLNRKPLYMQNQEILA